LKASYGWSDYSFKHLLTLLKDMLPQGNAVPETVYEVKLIIYLLGLKVEKFTCARMIAFYIVSLFVDSTDSLVEKTVVMRRTVTEIEEKADLKKCFDTFLSFLI
jgi:hypothetical protein